MKKFLLILTVLALMLGLVGCSGVSQEEYEAALADVAKLEAEVDDLKDELEDEIDAKQKEIDDLTAQVADLTAERDALTSTNDLLDTEIADLEGQITALEQENEELRAKLAQANNGGSSNGGGSNSGATMRMGLGNITFEVPKNWVADADKDLILFEVPDDNNPIAMVSYVAIDDMTAKEGADILADTSDVFYAELNCEIEVSEAESYNEFYYAVVSGQCTSGPIAEAAPIVVGVTFCDDTGFYFAAVFGTGDDTDAQVDYVANILDTAVSK